MMKRQPLLLVSAAAAVALAIPVWALKWGGTGFVSVDPISVESGKSATITYSVSGSDEKDPVKFHCEVKGPGGAVFTVQGTSSPWKDGKAHVVFTFPSDFSDANGVHASTTTSGRYVVDCYWEIKEGGKAERTAGASSEFAVEAAKQ